MGKTKPRFAMIGTCPKCGQQFIRGRDITIAICTCDSVTEVPLRPAILFRATVTIPVEAVEKKILEELRKYEILGGSKKLGGSK